jgi:predicted hotdog family 3-hydroxylacyl-ACP dehydratase
MLLLDELCEAEGDRVVCRVVLREGSPFVEGGRVHAPVALEYMAQAVGVYAGLESLRRGEPIRIGYVVGSRELEFAVDHLAVGDDLRVEARHVWGDDTLGSFACRVLRDGEPVASGTLNVYRGPIDARGVAAP